MRQACREQRSTLFASMMSQAPAKPDDPIGLSLLMALGFAGLCAINLAIPGKPYFDEIHYLPAARELLERGLYINREHPLFAKQLIALGIALFGDNPLGWRIFSVTAGALALFASMRAMWFSSLSRFATLSYGALLASGFLLYVQSRIAMLDIFMAAFLAVGAWQFVAAMREPETGRYRLIVCGVAIGLAMGSKWNAFALAPLPGVVFFLARLSAGRRRLFTSKRGIPIRGMSLVEAFVWLGLLPLTIYALTFAPAWELKDTPFAAQNLISFHREMLALQMDVIKPHPYQSNWPDWVTNTRAIWYLYENVDGAQRGVLLVGNPLTMLLGLAALIWCMVSGLMQREWARLGVVAGYLTSLGLWFAAAKPVQFYYHYFVPSFFLLAALALALDALWSAGHRKLAGGVIAASLALFMGFYPILSAAPLADETSFLHWTWIQGWR